MELLQQLQAAQQAASGTGWYGPEMWGEMWGENEIWAEGWDEWDNIRQAVRSWWENRMVPNLTPNIG
jgi:hypothetical protein